MRRLLAFSALIALVLCQQLDLSYDHQSGQLKIGIAEFPTNATPKLVQGASHTLFTHDSVSGQYVVTMNPMLHINYTKPISVDEVTKYAVWILPIEDGPAARTCWMELHVADIESVTATLQCTNDCVTLSSMMTMGGSVSSATLATVSNCGGLYPAKSAKLAVELTKEKMPATAHSMNMGFDYSMSQSWACEYSTTTARSYRMFDAGGRIAVVYTVLQLGPPSELPTQEVTVKAPQQHTVKAMVGLNSSNTTSSTAPLSASSDILANLSSSGTTIASSESVPVWGIIVLSLSGVMVAGGFVYFAMQVQKPKYG